jgi:hypothetical protein
MSWLRRGFVAATICAASLVYAAVTWSVFPRSLTGIILLVLIGAPLALAGEVLADIALHGPAQRPIARAAAAVGIGLLLLFVWWVVLSDTSHLRQYLQAG